ncbi:MAG TPA: ATP-binding protein [Candidatus Acidoferrales bacterium]|nr:ATP-binding protein [Candidatus Acidoferrales bacterium]
MKLRLKTKLVLAISGMVFTLVAVLSFLYVSQLMKQRIAFSYDEAEFSAQQILHGARQALETDLSSTHVDTSDPEQVHDAIAYILQSDSSLNALLQSVIGYNPEVFDAAIADTSGRALLHTDAAALGRTLPNRPELAALRDGGIVSQLKAVYGAPRVYELRLPIQRDNQRFGEIRIGLSTIFLKNELRPQLDHALIFSTSAIFISFLLAASLSNLALRPLETIARRLDAMTADVAVPEPEPPRRKTDEFGAVNTKIDRLGRQIRDVKEVFSALKENLDQIMGTLQDGLMLFTRDARLVLVSASAERFVGRPRAEMLGLHVEEIFDDSTRLGRIVLDAFALHQDVATREVEVMTGRRLQVGLDFIEERGQPIGALLTMRDVESVRRIENEIELSHRLASIGRLTSGVAHEVKNPINAIVIHLEILRERMIQLDPDTRRHMDIITKEIHRLDRVVKTLVDFTRPVELKLADLDLRALASDVVALAAPEAGKHNVQIEDQSSERELRVRVDNDLVRQAVLNVVINGIQAMPDGGTLTVTSRAVGEAAVLEIHDEGTGIPPELRDKIFNLYFTTKSSGSGIGLAMTYRVMQLHNGALDFASEPGQGTTFRLQFPLTAGAFNAEAQETSSGAAQHTMEA